MNYRIYKLASIVLFIFISLTYSALSQIVPTVYCTTEGSIFNTANQTPTSALQSGLDRSWEYTRTTIYHPPKVDIDNPAYQAGSAEQTVPPSSVWKQAVVVNSLAAGWHISPYSNATWISNRADAKHNLPEDTEGPEYSDYPKNQSPEDIFYRYQFNIDQRVDTSSLNMNMSFWADDVVYEVWVNGTAQGIKSTQTGHPYSFAGYLSANGATGRLTGPWKKGAGANNINEIIIHIKSIGGFQGFLAQFEPGALCQPRLTLEKVVKNDNGGTRVVSDFTLAATGPTTISGKSGAASVTNTLVDGGLYNLSETPAPASVGYQQTINCSTTRLVDESNTTIVPSTTASLQLQTGDIAECVITNDDLAATLTLKKQVINDNGGTKQAADFTLRAQGPTPITGPSGAVSVTNAKVNAGSYTLSETAVPGYSSTGAYSCVVNGGAPVVGNTVNLPLASTAVCTITNDDIAPKLTLKKLVRNENGGVAQAQSFTLRAQGPSTITGTSGSAAVTNATVSAGTYVLSETPIPGYAASGTYRCSIDGKAEQAATNNSITLSLGQSAVCTITNIDEAAQLTLIKQVQNSSIGKNVPIDFTLKADGPTPIIGKSGSAAVTNAQVKAGTYTLSELPLQNYVAEGPYQCVVNAALQSPGNSLTLVPGDVAVCTIKNIDQGAKLTLKKIVINDSGGTATAADFILMASGPKNIEGITGNPAVTGALVPLGEYKLGEKYLPGYAGSLYSCSVNGAAPVFGNTIVLAKDNEAVCTVTNNDIAVKKALVGENGLFANVAEPGEVLTYAVTLENDSKMPGLYNLIDDIDDNTSYVAGSTVGASEPTGSDPLEWKGLIIPAMGKLTVTYKLKVVDLFPPGVSTVRNCAGSTCTEMAASGKVSTTKRLIGEKGGIQTDIAEPGEILTYEVELKNEGNGPAVFDLGDAADKYLTYIPGSTRGTSGAGEPKLSPVLLWSGITVLPNKPVTVIYDMRVADNLPLGTKELKNISFSPAEISKGDPSAPISIPPNYCELNPASCSKAETMDLSLTKVADVAQISRGSIVPFTIRVVNNGSAPVRNLTITDNYPAGFSFVSGSATVDGKNDEPEMQGRSLNFTIPVISSGQEIVIRLSFRALASLKAGEYANAAGMSDPSGRPAAFASSASFEIAVETMFDCSEIVGTVFNDHNRNGYQDNSEEGMPGVRVASVNGIFVSTDKDGKFSIACADIPDGRIGSNLILKLDPRSLPTGYRAISENPRVIRITAGKISNINFATSLTRVVRLDINSAAFITGTAELDPLWERSVQSLFVTLETEPSILRIFYRDSSTDKNLANQRLKAVHHIIASQWREKPNRYRLEIEAQLLIGNAAVPTGKFQTGWLLTEPE